MARRDACLMVDSGRDLCWVTGRRCDNVGMTNGVLQITADWRQR